jgi:hypothetical protein
VSGSDGPIHTEYKMPPLDTVSRQVVRTAKGCLLQEKVVPHPTAGAGFVKSWIENDQKRVWTGMNHRREVNLKSNRGQEGRPSFSCLSEIRSDRQAPMGPSQQTATVAHSRCSIIVIDEREYRCLSKGVSKAKDRTNRGPAYVFRGNGFQAAISNLKSDFCGH